MIATRSIAGTLWAWIVVFAVVGWIVGTVMNLIGLAGM